MATYVPAKKNTAFITYVGLPSQANALTLQANPTLAAGDAKVAIDDGAPANLATLPAVDADFTKRVKVSLSADEMNGDNITVIFSDAAGAEWCDVLINIQTAASQIDDIPTTTEFEARTLPSADYTIVSDLGTVQSGDSYAIVNGDHGLVSIQDDIDAILEDTGTTLENRLIAIEADTDVIDDGTSGLVKIASDVAAILTDTGTTLDGDIQSILSNQVIIDGKVDALNDISVADIIAGVADGVYDLQEMLRIIFAACSGKSSGGGTATLIFRDSADATDRITATVDSNGNRTAITLDAS